MSLVSLILTASLFYYYCIIQALIWELNFRPTNQFEKGKSPIRQQGALCYLVAWTKASKQASKQATKWCSWVIEVTEWLWGC